MVKTEEDSIVRVDEGQGEGWRSSSDVCHKHLHLSPKLDGKLKKKKMDGVGKGHII
jgi:hypothetical protein